MGKWKTYKNRRSFFNVFSLDPSSPPDEACGGVYTAFGKSESDYSKKDELGGIGDSGWFEVEIVR